MNRVNSPVAVHCYNDSTINTAGTTTITIITSQPLLTHLHRLMLQCHSTHSCLVLRQVLPDIYSL